MDISKTTEPRSDQINFDDVTTSTITVTVSEVKRGSAEQPVEVHLVEFPGRPFKPSKSMRRVLVACWGPEASAYAGRQMVLFGDPTVKFGGQVVGGIRISALSHIDEPKTISLTVTRGKRAPFVVQPITVPDSGVVGAALDDIEQASSIPALKAAWDLAGKRGVQAHADVIAAKEKRKVELGQPPETLDPADPNHVEVQS